MDNNAVAVIVGGAFQEAELGGIALEPVHVRTSEGEVRLYRYPGEREAYVLYRHGLPHCYLPNQIPYLAHAQALSHVGCAALLVTSSAAVLDAAIPFGEPLLVEDMFYPDNRLPDGRACTVFQQPAPGQAHLILDEGFFSAALQEQVRGMLIKLGTPAPRSVKFGYFGGPRTKSRFENAVVARWGVQVNSMTVAPEVVLANELGIATAAVVVGHKYTPPVPGAPDELGVVRNYVDDSKTALEKLVVSFLEKAEPVAFGNRFFSS